MRSNTMKKALHDGGRVVCVQPSFPSPEVVEFLGYLGFDSVLIDAEHGVVGVERALEMVRAAHVIDIATLIRVPTNEPAVILGYLEGGAGGVLLPHVNTAEQAQAAAMGRTALAPFSIAWRMRFIPIRVSFWKALIRTTDMTA